MYGFLNGYPVLVVEYIMYNVHCTLYSVQCTVYNVQLYSVQCSVYSAHRTLYSIQCTVYSVQNTVYSAHRTLFSIQCTVQCTVYGVLYTIEPELPPGISLRRSVSLLPWLQHHPYTLRYRTCSRDQGYTRNILRSSVSFVYCTGRRS